MTQQPLPGGFQLDPALKQYLAQQRTREFFDRIGQIGQGMVAASMRGADFLPALAMGVSRAGGYGRGRGPGRGGGGLLDVLEMQRKINAVRSQQETRQRERKQDYARDALSTGRMPAGLDPNSGINWDTPRQRSGSITMANEPPALGLPNQIAGAGPDYGRSAPRQSSAIPPELAQLLPPRGLSGRQGWGGPTERRALATQAYPEAAGRAQAAEIFGTPKAPNVQTFYDQGSGREYKGQWNPGTGQWDRVGGMKTRDGGLTDAQQAHNAEIAQARATLERMGLDKAEITRRTQKATNTGRENPDYDPGIDRVVRAATDRMVGDDPDYGMYHNRYLGPAPEFSEAAGPKALPPGVSAVPPGLWQRTQDFLFGPGSSASQPSRQGNGATPPAASQRRRGRRRGQRGQAAPSQPDPNKSIETMSQDELMALIYGDRPLSQDEINRLDARLNELGVGPQGG